MNDGGGVTSSLGEHRRRLAGLVGSVVLILAAVALAISGSSDGDGGGNALAEPAQLSDAAGVASLEDRLGHPVYWAGERPPSKLELSVDPYGNAYLRYLPADAKVGDARAGFLTVATYPVADGQAATRRAARGAGVSVEVVAGGGIALPSPASRGGVYLAYPGSDLQIEVYDPQPGRAMELIRSGAIRPVGEG